jgi:hypothetical protein
VKSDTTQIIYKEKCNSKLFFSGARSEFIWFSVSSLPTCVIAFGCIVLSIDVVKLFCSVTWVTCVRLLLDPTDFSLFSGTKTLYNILLIYLLLVLLQDESGSKTSDIKLL